MAVAAKIRGLELRVRPVVKAIEPRCGLSSSQVSKAVTPIRGSAY